MTTRFGISPQQASADIAEYRSFAPENIEYDQTRKLFVASPSFSPRFMEPDARNYLSQLLLIGDDAIAPGDSWLGAVPAFDIMHRIRRRLKHEVLRPILLAIHRKEMIQIVYQSMSSPEPTERWIAPHALVFDGARWHARSWCFNRSKFTDFVLARVIEVGERVPNAVDQKLDRQWNEKFVVQLGPNPGLTPSQRKAIELDYGMDDGRVEVPMRLCLTYYFERHYGLDLSTETLKPTRKQVVILNYEELKQARQATANDDSHD